ncbi:MAG: hypothetical protein HQL17_07460 [Candidatus Omnitrophica bacterium]|nr:hypothetical protein [Candidatus Omnitrophota bacterium]
MKKYTAPYENSKLWLIPVVLPLLLIIFSYALTEWSWGLMDDLTLLSVPGSVWDRTKIIFQLYFNFGEMKWTHALHCAVFYKVFSASPKAFHFFKFSEIAVTLGIWGLLAWRLTGRSVALLLFSAIALTFHYLYDQFFFLSTHETTGLLFLGLGLYAIAVVEIEPKDVGRRICGWLVAVAALVASLGAKEPFLTGILSAGISLFWLGCNTKDRRGLVWMGVGCAIAALGYGVYLKVGVSKAYTAGYSLMDISRMAANLIVWAKKIFLNHVPWIVVCGGVLGLTGGFPKWRDLSLGERFGLVLAAALYCSFLGVFLPWAVTSYYVGPLGLFFALAVSVLLARRIELLDGKRSLALILFATVFTGFMAFYTLNRESTYHYDTQNLWAWMKGNGDFQEKEKKEQVFCNAMEGSVAIPGHANRWWGLGLKNFAWESGGISKALGRGARYYVFSKRFGELDQTDLKGWRTVFYSKFWQVYQKE